MMSALGQLLRPFHRRLDVRIVTLFLALLLLVQLIAFVAIRHSIDRNAAVQINNELRNGEHVLRRLLAQNAQKLSGGARLLANDFGFRSAVASDDQGTIRDALDNRANRIGAKAAALSDAWGALVASTGQFGPALLPLLARSNSIGDDGVLMVIDAMPFQLVKVAVRAPSLVGHVSMGFPLDGNLVRDLESMSSLRVALMARPLAGGAWALLPVGERVGTLSDLATQLGDAATAIATGQQVTLAGETHGLRVVPLAQSSSHEVAAVLLRSVEDALAPYRELQFILIAITLGAVAIFGVGSYWMARRIVGPIKQLSSSAERLGQGDFNTPVMLATHDEVNDLAQSFELMRVSMQQREAQILRLAYWDQLTALPNREQLLDVLRAHLARSQQSNTPCAVLMLDLDRFKQINDVLGHDFGDLVLKQIAARLGSGTLREGDLVARLSGDEFAICLPDTNAATAMLVAQRVRQAIDRPLLLDDHTVDVSAGVGVATFPDHGYDAELLLGRAEMAMYTAKERQTGVMMYDPELDSASSASLSLLSELRTAVDRDQLRLYLQPKLALDGSRIVGAEALVRWQHPVRGLVPPMQFIPFAEQTGFIRAITGWMIERCAERSAALRAQGFDLKMSVNLSARDLVDQNLPGKIGRLLARHAMPLASLCLEITESAIMDDPQRAMQTLAKLKDMGLRLSIDDFGTGYSSLAYLKRLPLHELKIDRSFVMAMESDRADMNIVRSTIDLAHNLGLAVVAEGVENAGALQLLNQMGCDEAQGYFIAKPMPEEEFSAWLQERHNAESECVGV